MTEAARLFDTVFAGRALRGERCGSLLTTAGDGGPKDEGSYYSNARWYDPSTGRFISEDPVMDGTLWYAYVNNNPMTFTDPTGMDAEDAATTGMGGPNLRDASLTYVEDVYMKDKALFEALRQVPLIREPVPLEYGPETVSDYGWREDPITGQRAFHAGTDIIAKVSADTAVEVRAAHHGKVVKVAQSEEYGNYVVVEYDAYHLALALGEEKAEGLKPIQTIYAHLEKTKVQVGDSVVAGMSTVGVMGSTGRSTGRHLHFAVTYGGEFIDPLLFARRPAP